MCVCKLVVVVTPLDWSKTPADCLTCCIHSSALGIVTTYVNLWPGGKIRRLVHFGQPILHPGHHRHPLIYQLLLESHICWKKSFSTMPTLITKLACTLFNEKKLLDYSISGSWHVFINTMYLLCTVLHAQHACAEHVRITVIMWDLRIMAMYSVGVHRRSAGNMTFFQWY